LSDVERVEADGYAVFCGLAGGFATRVRGGVCLYAPFPAPELNRVADVTAELDLEAVAAAFDGKPHGVSVPPRAAALGERLTEHGYTEGYAWMKFERGLEPAPSVDTELRVEETRDAAVFGRTGAEGMGLPPEASAGIAVAGRPGWHCFLAWDGGEPAAAASLYVDGAVAWFGGAATRPAFRGRGAQHALLAVRIERARALRVERMSVETGARVEGKPNHSYRNILRAGFHEAYLRPNWRSPA
jgi:GNAT superfamily N-acetyltransferase